jgi:hypothetical protein
MSVLVRIEILPRKKVSVAATEKTEIHKNSKVAGPAKIHGHSSQEKQQHQVVSHMNKMYITRIN